MNPVVTSKKAPIEDADAADYKIPEVRDWLTRNEASDMLSCSTQTLVNYERKGALHPQHAYRPDGRGVEHRVIVYDPKELAKLATRMNRHNLLPRDPGELAGRAFDLFDENKLDKDVVKELRLTPDAVQVLREKWENMGGSKLVISPVAKEALERMVGPFETVTDLVELVTQLKKVS